MTFQRKATPNSSYNAVDLASNSLRAVHGSGAFRHFRSAVERLGLLDAWYRYRGEAIEQIARD